MVSEELDNYNTLLSVDDRDGLVANAILFVHPYRCHLRDYTVTTVVITAAYCIGHIIKYSICIIFYDKFLLPSTPSINYRIYETFGFSNLLIPL